MQAEEFPVKQRCFSETVGDHTTDFLISTYADCNLVIVSQTGSVGTLLRAKCVCKPISLGQSAEAQPIQRCWLLAGA